MSDATAGPLPRPVDPGFPPPRRASPPPTVAAVLAALLITALVVVTVLMVTTLGFFDIDDAGGLIGFTALSWALYAAVFWMLRHVPARVAVVLILTGTVALSAAAMAGPPNTSTDSARYAWDGIVQDAGISPYLYVPADDALAPYRTPWLFPAAVNDAGGHPQCPDSARYERTLAMSSFTVLCTTINRPLVNTIYPPTAELYFAGVRMLVPASAEYWPFQAGGALIVVAVTIVLLVVLRRRSLDPRWAALWGLSPFVASEAVTNSHVDALAALLTLVAALLVSRGSRAGRSRRGRATTTIAGAAVLGLAIATKLVPVIAVPALLRKHSVRIIVTAALTFALLYVPYVVTTGFGVIGYLPGYLSEEGYDDGTRFALISTFAPGGFAIVAAGIALLLTAIVVWRTTDPANPWLGQVVMIGVTLFVVTPHYSWYALLLVPFIALSGRWEWMALPAALTVQLLVPTLLVARLAFFVAIVIIVAGVVVRRRRSDRTLAASTGLTARS